MSDINVFKWGVIAFIAVVVLSLIAMVIAFEKSNDEFRLVCEQSKGTTVWDGRQYQCIKPGE